MKALDGLQLKKDATLNERINTGSSNAHAFAVERHMCVRLTGQDPLNPIGEGRLVEVE